MKYICRYIDSLEQEQVITFEGENITFKYAYNEVNNAPQLSFMQTYSDFKEVQENGLLYASNSFDITGYNYSFATVINDKEFVFFRMDRIVEKDYSIGYDYKDNNTLKDIPFIFYLELI